MTKCTKKPTEIQPVILAKNSREQYRLAVEEYHGHICIDARVFYLDDDNEYRPSRKGLSIRMARWSAFRASLEELEERMKGAGLLDVEDDTDV